MKKLITLTFVLVCLSCHADDEKISLDAAPAPVQQAAKAAAGSSEIVKVEKASEDGGTQYEVLTKDSAGKKTEYAFKPDGTLASTEEKLTEADLPKAAQEKLPSLVGQGKIHGVERVTEGSAVTFEVGYKSATGEKREAVFSLDGKLQKDGADND